MLEACAVLVWLGLWSLLTPPTCGQDGTTPKPLTVEQIIERMTVMDRERIESLRNYIVRRRYRVENKRFHKTAEMVVVGRYAYPGV